MNNKLISFKMNFLKNIGDMSEKKIEVLAKEFSSDFPNRNDLPLGILLTKQIDSNSVKSLLITSGQVTYMQEGENIKADFYEAKKMVKRVFDKLYLDYKCNGICNYSSLIEGSDSSNSLKERINLNLKTNIDISGIGFKVFLQGEDYNGNFVFEPYLRDFKYYFCAIEAQLVKALGVNDVIKEGERAFNELFSDLTNSSYYKFTNMGEI